MRRISSRSRSFAPSANPASNAIERMACCSLVVMGCAPKRTTVNTKHAWRSTVLACSGNTAQDMPMKLQRLSVLDIVAMKRRGERIAALTAYDYTSAQMVDAAGVPFILIGDTLGMVVQGHDTTLPATLDQIISHAQMVES